MNKKITNIEKFQHLELIQNVILRMSAASSNTKSWLIPVIAGSYAFAITQRSVPVVALGLSCVIIFAYVDAKYLDIEKKYVFLYHLVQSGEETVSLYSLDVSRIISKSNGYQLEPISKHLKINTLAPSKQAIKSWSILPFYAFIFLVGILILTLLFLDSITTF